MPRTPCLWYPPPPPDIINRSTNLGWLRQYGVSQPFRWLGLTARSMSRCTATHWLVLLAIGGLMSFFLYDTVQERIRTRMGARDGLQDAEVDLAAGQLKLMFAGKPPSCREQMKTILRERYGVAIEYVGGCCPSEYRSAYNEAYNRRIDAALQSRAEGFNLALAYNNVREEAGKAYQGERNDCRHDRGR